MTRQRVEHRHQTGRRPLLIVRGRVAARPKLMRANPRFVVVETVGGQGRPIAPTSIIEEVEWLLRDQPLKMPAALWGNRR